MIFVNRVLAFAFARTLHLRLRELCRLATNSPRVEAETGLFKAQEKEWETGLHTYSQRVGGKTGLNTVQK
jgi:hypothetical protein